MTLVGVLSSPDVRLPGLAQDGVASWDDPGPRHYLMPIPRGGSVKLRCWLKISIPIVLAGLTGVALASGPAPAAAAAPAAPAATAAPATPAAQGSPVASGPSAAPSRSFPGVIAVVDPQTGELYEPPPGVMRDLMKSAEFQKYFTAQADDETLVETRLPGGGYRVGPTARFQSMLMTVVTPEGRVVTGHLVIRKAPAPPEAARPTAGSATKGASRVEASKP